MDLTPTDEDRADAIESLPEVFPGVHGYVVDRGAILFINIIWAAVEGSGQVGRYLDSLRDRRVHVTSVYSERLAGMLARRGYRLSIYSGSWEHEP